METRLAVSTLLLLAFFFQGKPTSSPKKQNEETRKNSPPKKPRIPLTAPKGTGQAKDLMQKFPKPTNPLLGLWRLRKQVIPGTTGARRKPSGYLLITRTHISMHLVRSALVPGGPIDFQSSIRTYSIQGIALNTVSLMGVRNSQTPGKIIFEARGLRETRRFALLGPNVLRVYQTPTSYMELIKEAGL
jgi:hypothetical protein